MKIPTDRLLIMIVVATAFAVLAGGWAAALVHAEATGVQEWAWRVAIGIVFLAVLVGFWLRFSTIDEEREDRDEPSADRI